MDEPSGLSRRHAIGFFVVGGVELASVAIASKVFGFSVGDVLLLKVDAAGLFVIGGYLFLLCGVYLLFKKDTKDDKQREPRGRR